MQTANVNTVLAPVAVGAVSLNNHVVMAPLTRTRAKELGVPSELAVEYPAQRVTLISSLQRRRRSHLKARAICAPLVFICRNSWTCGGQIAEALHQRGSKIVLQLLPVGKIAAAIKSGQTASRAPV